MDILAMKWHGQGPRHLKLHQYPLKTVASDK